MVPAADFPGVYCGEFEDGSRRALHYQEGNLSILTIGPPGTSKTTGLIIPAVASQKQSMIVIDVKGQIAATTIDHRSKLGPALCINPKGLWIEERPAMLSIGWNPILQLDPKINFMVDAASLADAIVTKSESGSGSSRFFDLSARNLVALFIMHERLTNFAAPSFRNVMAALAEPTLWDKDKTPRAGFAATVAAMADSENFAIGVMAKRIYARITDAGSQNTSLQDVIETALKELTFALDDDVACDMAYGGAIDWAGLHREITTIYFVVPLTEIDPDGLGKVARMFINLALRGLYRNLPPSPALLPRVLFILDEFGSCLGRLTEIPKALGVARDSSITLWFILQSISQLKTNYKNEWSLFYAGSGVKQCFRAGDLETAEYFSKVFGNREQAVMTEQLTGGQSLTPQAIPLMRPEDLMRLPDRSFIQLIKPCPNPIRSHAPVYTQTRWAADIGANPYYRG